MWCECENRTGEDLPLLERVDIWLEKMRCSSKLKLRLRAVV